MTKFAIALAVAVLACLYPTPTRCALFACAVRLFAVSTRSFFSCDFFCCLLCRSICGARSRLSVAKERDLLCRVRSSAVFSLAACPPRLLCVLLLWDSSPCFCPHFFFSFACTFLRIADSFSFISRPRAGVVVSVCRSRSVQPRAKFSFFHQVLAAHSTFFSSYAPQVLHRCVLV